MGSLKKSSKSSAKAIKSLQKKAVGNDGTITGGAATLSGAAASAQLQQSMDAMHKMFGTMSNMQKSTSDTAQDISSNNK
jgi:hypothetical protein